jgi:hypothetical protein
MAKRRPPASHGAALVVLSAVIGYILYQERALTV